MRDRQAILDAYGELTRTGGRAVLATVVRVQRSAYAGPGRACSYLPDASRSELSAGLPRRRCQDPRKADDHRGTAACRPLRFDGARRNGTAIGPAGAASISSPLSWCSRPEEPYRKPIALSQGRGFSPMEFGWTGGVASAVRKTSISWTREPAANGFSWAGVREFPGPLDREVYRSMPL